MMTEKEFVELYLNATEGTRTQVKNLLSEELTEIIKLFTNLTPERREIMLYVAKNMDKSEVMDVINRANNGELTPDQTIELFNRLRVA